MLLLAFAVSINGLEMDEIAYLGMAGSYRKLKKNSYFIEVKFAAVDPKLHFTLGSPTFIFGIWIANFYFCSDMVMLDGSAL